MCSNLEGSALIVFIKNKLVCDGKITGYTVNVNNEECRHSVHEAAKLVYAATYSNVVIVCNRYIKLKTNNGHIKAHLNNSHLRSKSGRMPILSINT